MRSFIAINPTDEVRAGLYRAVEPLRSSPLPGRWVGEESLHLTLQFLGNVKDDRRREHVLRTVSGIADRSDPFRMRVRGFGAFPSVRRPRVIWAGIDPEPALMRLQEELESQLAGLGFEPEKRDYHPHITLGRVRDRGSRAERGRLDRLAGMLDAIEYDVEFEVRSIDLMKSTLSPRGARYDIVRACEL